MPGLAMPFRQNPRRLGTAKIFPRHPRRKIFLFEPKLVWALRSGRRGRRGLRGAAGLGGGRGRGRHRSRFSGARRYGCVGRVALAGRSRRRIHDGRVILGFLSG
jgi:hypothetical protein